MLQGIILLPSTYPKRILVFVHLLYRKLCRLSLVLGMTRRKTHITTILCPVKYSLPPCQQLLKTRVQRNYQSAIHRLKSTASISNSRHVRILKRGLFGVDPTLGELHGENEACCVARARARLLLALANCNAVPSVTEDPAAPEGSKGDGGQDAVLRRVRDAADCILGEVLQVMKYPHKLCMHSLFV